MLGSVWIQTEETLAVRINGSHFISEAVQSLSGRTSITDVLRHWVSEVAEVALTKWEEEELETLQGD